MESLRGIAAVAVAVFHTINLPYARGLLFVSYYPPHNTSPTTLLEWTFRLFFNGQSAVVLFFVLSGFVLRLSLGRMGTGTGRLALKFLWMRLFRLYPAIIVALALYILLFWTTGLTHSPHGANSFKPHAILRNYLLLEATIIGPLWSLQIEVLAIPLILFAYLLERRFGWIALVLLGGILGALAFTLRWPSLLRPNVLTIAPMYSFVIGMFTASMGRRTNAHLGRNLATLVVLVCLTGYFLVGITEKSLVQWGLLITSVASAGLIWVFAYGPPISANAWLRRRTVRFLGRISYSFYLLHAMFVFAVGAMASHFRPLIKAGISPAVVGGVLAAVVVGLTIPCAALLHRWVEIPGLAAGKRSLAWLIGRSG